MQIDRISSELSLVNHSTYALLQIAAASKAAISVAIEDVGLGEDESILGALYSLLEMARASHKLTECILGATGRINDYRRSSHGYDDSPPPPTDDDCPPDC